MADFVNADDYCLEQSTTRKFYEFFLKGYIHKHNNLMGVIQGFSSLILYDDSINEEVRESAEQMQTAAKSATELNREILGATGCARCEPAPMRLSDVLPYWVGKATEICGAKGVAFQHNAPEGLPPVMADSNRLGEVYIHLLRNAAESAAAFPGSSVTLEFVPAPGGVVILLRNPSAAFDADGLRRCFLPFESSKGSEHFGIGLTAAAVLSGDMGVRLGLCWENGIMTARLAVPAAA
jgi:signal transduction histidine kinase